LAKASHDAAVSTSRENMQPFRHPIPRARDAARVDVRPRTPRARERFGDSSSPFSFPKKGTARCSDSIGRATSTRRGAQGATRADSI
jgi:hypothetical protein